MRWFSLHNFWRVACGFSFVGRLLTAASAYDAHDSRGLTDSLINLCWIALAVFYAERAERLERTCGTARKADVTHTEGRTVVRIWWRR